VIVDLPAGDYLISDGYGQQGALDDAWNYQLAVAGSWDSHFYAAVEQGTSSTYELLIDGLSNTDPSCTYHNCSWSNEAQASAAYLATPTFNLHLASDAAVSFSSTSVGQRWRNVACDQFGSGGSRAGNLAADGGWVARGRLRSEEARDIVPVAGATGP
jgi:hypothetical protein